ncbi:MAG: SAM-dependent methyltransferase, partial [Burkholderiales bacterium]|nr:SAM-dependent methyltransferase [Burkholderiales bacterium]
MIIHSGQLDAAAEALRIVLKFEQPADSVLSNFFRGHRKLSQLDRAFIAESIFGLLRRKRLVDHLCTDGSPRRALLAYLTRAAGVSMRELSAALTGDEAEWVARLKATATGELPLAVQADLPDWLIERLVLQMPEADILALGRALQQPAPLDLRVNTLRADRSTVLRQLAATGIE